MQREEGNAFSNIMLSIVTTYQRIPHVDAESQSYLYCLAIRACHRQCLLGELHCFQLFLGAHSESLPISCDNDLSH